MNPATVFGGQIENAVMEITNRCNLRCPHCASNSGVSRPDEMVLDEIIHVIRDLKSLGCRVLTLLGGELILRPDWFDVAQAVKAAGIELQLVTNGILVDDKVRKKFHALDPETVGVSVDGSTPASYRAIRGVDGLEHCLRLMDDMLADGFREVHAITTFNAKNLQDFDGFVELFLDTPVVWQIQMAHRGGERFPEDWLMTRKQFKLLVNKVVETCQTYGRRLRLMTMDDFGYFPLTEKLQTVCHHWNGCQGGRSVIGIRANGDVLPCLSLGDAFIGGNLRARSLIEIWRDPASFPGFRDDDMSLTGRCRGCPRGHMCRAGCSAMAFSQTGTLTETAFCIRQLEQEEILKVMIP